MPQRIFKLVFLNFGLACALELARILGVSQPTLTRNRKKLEDSGMIQDYTIIPNFREMGFKILALTFIKTLSRVQTNEVLEKANFIRYGLKAE